MRRICSDSIVAPVLCSLVLLATGCSTTDVWPLAKYQSVAWNTDMRLPNTVRAPRGHVLLGHAVGRGVATFTLQADPNDPDNRVWVMTNDEGGALLDDAGRPVGQHSAGNWSFRGEGGVTAQPVAQVAHRNRGPEVLYEATSHQGGGNLSTAEYVEQLHVVGGPRAQAVQGDIGTQIRAEYSADYYFYGPLATQTRHERGATWGF